MSWGALSFVFISVSVFAQVPPAQVRQETLTLPTHVEGLPDFNPPFDYFQGSRPFYPYTRRLNFTTQTVNHAWRALILENEFLKCTILPDLGGHLYNCLDKQSGHNMFYANPSVKKQDIALRGSWVAMGVELNFPVAHSWVTVSPVDFATAHNADGSASAWAGSVDRVYGLQWRVEFVLRPGSTLVEQKVTLYNPTSVRRRFSWWANAEIEEEDPTDTFLFPMFLTLTHGAPFIDTWPVTADKTDLSVVGNHKGFGLGLFAYKSSEEYFSLYHPRTRTGTVHFASLDQVRGKKLWTWQSEGDKYARSELSDNNSTGVEIQAGYFDQQLTFGFIAPQQIIRFSEYWMPVRELAGISRANQNAVLSLSRRRNADGSIALTAALNVNHAIPGATVRISNGDQLLLESTADVSPSAVFSRTADGIPAAPSYRFQLLDGDGALLMEHVEGKYNALTSKDVTIGVQPERNWSIEIKLQDYLDTAEYNELNGFYTLAWGDYDRALKAFGNDTELLKRSGRLSVVIHRFSEGIQRLSLALSKTPDDAEIQYYLGTAYAASGDDAHARAELEPLIGDPQFGAPASLQFAYLLSRSGDYESALAAVQSLEQTRAGAIELALLRKLERWDDAAARVAYWLSVDPTNNTFRWEQFVLGMDDGYIQRHLAADPERILDIADHYLRLGLPESAAAVLDRSDQAIDPLESEPGVVLPQNYPLIAYYRAFAKDQSGGSGKDDYALASKQSSLYVFPNRASSLPVLQAALKQNPNDATAHALLGCLYLSFQMVDEAIAEWQKARTIRQDLPALHRNLGRALLDIKHDAATAIVVLREGLIVEPNNPELQDALNRALALPH